MEGYRTCPTLCKSSAQELFFRHLVQLLLPMKSSLISYLLPSLSTCEIRKSPVHSQVVRHQYLFQTQSKELNGYHLC